MTNLMLHEFYLNKEKKKLEKKKGRRGDRRVSETVQAVKKNVCLARKIHK